MSRAYGSYAILLMKEESSYGTKPSGNYNKLPFVSSDLGGVQPLINSDVLGQGREPRAPFYDIVTVDGNIVVPIDVRNTGFWLKQLLSTPVSDNNPASGSVLLSENPTNSQTIVLNGVTVTFTSGSSTGAVTTPPAVNIKGSLALTLDELSTVLNASTNTLISVATYTDNNTNTLTITHDTDGSAGNAYTLGAGTVNSPTLSGATLTGGGYSHTYESGSDTLPSCTIEVGHPQVPNYFVQTGVRINSMAFNFQRSGPANMTLNVLGQKETSYTSSQGGTPTEKVYKPFNQFQGAIKKDGSTLGNITSAQFTYSNQMEVIQTIRNDASAEGIDPTLINITGSIDARFADTTLLDAATSQTPVELEFEYKISDHEKIVVTLHEVYLPTAKVPVNGPGGISSTFEWQAVYNSSEEKSATFVLHNDVTNYN